PSAVASLIIDNITTTSVSLRWPIPLGNISSYIIQVLGTPSKEPMRVNTNSFLVDNLTPGNFYTFVVFVTNGNLNGTNTQNSTFICKYIKKSSDFLIEKIYFIIH
ncbi:hypothetical protein XELAEV_18004617mg, partial [Xenopus laevis]